LKAELGIRRFNGEIAHLLMNQWQKFLKSWEIQMEPMEELTDKVLRGQSG